MKKVVILNSGTGSRMGELTADKPKCLVEISREDTILTRQIRALLNCGLKDILITTGPFEDKIKNHLSGRFSGATISYVNNPRYEDTNYIYSLLLAGDMISGDLILMHGDLVFDRAVLEKLLASTRSNAVLVNPYIELPEKDFKAELKNGRVQRIGVNIFGEGSVFLVPIYKLTGAAFSAWLEEMKKFAEKGELKVYAENALNNLLGGLALHPVEYREEFCTEIDDLEDLSKVRNYLAENNDPGGIG